VGQTRLGRIEGTSDEFYELAYPWFNMSYEEDDLGERGCSQHPRGEIAGGIRRELACFAGEHSPDSRTFDGEIGW
jgi:hypothetical protein